jgi:hypothetical protein
MRAVSIVEFEKVSWPVRAEITVEFLESNNFTVAAKIFSRACCQPDAIERHGLPVLERHFQKTVQIIEAIFEHSKIVWEPHWVGSSREGWVDDLREEAIALKIGEDRRRFKTK